MVSSPPQPGVAVSDVFAGGNKTHLSSDSSHAGFDAHAAGHDDPFWNVIRLLVFLLAIWASGKVANRCKLPALAGEIICGMLLGPKLADFVPHSETVREFGELGLILLVIEAGLEVDLTILRQVGARGFIVGFLGSVCGPFLIGIGISLGFGLEIIPALAVGASLSPTSMGVALTVLKQGKVLNTPTGNLIVSAAVVDDVIALLLLSELKALMQPDDTMSFVKPILSAVCFIGGIGAFAVKVAPPLLSRVVIPRLPPNEVEIWLSVILAAWSLGLMLALHAGGASHLLGAFLAGLCFCSLHGFHHGHWHHQVKRVQSWLVRLFFAASVGFQIPAKKFGDAKVMSFAAALLAVLVGKVTLGVFATPLTWNNGLTIAFAMSAWGEFAFVVAEAAGGDLGIMDKDTQASVFIAVLFSVIAAPSALRFTIEYAAKAARKKAQAAAIDRKIGIIYYHLEVRCLNRWGLLANILSTIAAADVEVIEFRLHIAQGHGADSEDVVAYEAFLRDSRLFDEEPDTRHAVGLEERLADLQGKLMAQLTHDPEAILIHTAADLENGDEIKRAAADVLVVKQQEVASRASTGGEGVKRPPQGLGAVSTATSAAESLRRVRSFSLEPRPSVISAGLHGAIMGSSSSPPTHEGGTASAGGDGPLSVDEPSSAVERIRSFLVDGTVGGAPHNTKRFARLERWMPGNSPEEWAVNGDTLNAAAAAEMMRIHLEDKAARAARPRALLDSVGEGGPAGGAAGGGGVKPSLLVLMGSQEASAEAVAAVAQKVKDAMRRGQ